MYSMLGFLVLALVWLTLRLGEEDRSFRTQALWVLAGAAGLLTHYFFAFVWLACAGWLVWAGGPQRSRSALLAALTLALVAPWYAQVPDSLARWRVTGGWLDGMLTWPEGLTRPLKLAGGLLGTTSDLGGWRSGNSVLLALLVVVAVLLARSGAWRQLTARPVLLLWIAWLASCAGPLAFDLARHTTTSAVPRYFLSGLPVAVLLAALAIGRLPRHLSAAVLTLILLAWLPGTWKVAKTRVPRPNEPFVALDRRLETWAEPGDIVLVRSIPSGVIGVARYLQKDVPIVDWVAQLGTRRIPADLERVLRGRRRVAVASIHAVGAADSVGPWLTTNARLLGRETFPWSSAEILYFGLSE